jgi:hypothetical protein
MTAKRPLGWQTPVAAALLAAWMLFLLAMAMS